MEADLGQFCRRVTLDLQAGDLNAALEKIVEFVIGVILLRTSTARVFSAPELDDLCLRIGARESGPAALVPGDQREDHVVYLVTELARTGGHTRLLRDLIAADGAKRQTILISNITKTTVMADLISLFADSEVTIHMAPSGDLLGCLSWLQMQLAEFRPCRTYILPHHFDAVLIAACQPDLVGRLIYIHNCDHALALGVHLPHTRHVDLHDKGFYHCRETEGLKENVLWPLVVADGPHRAEEPFLVSGHLTTCTSGGTEKFEATHCAEQVPYLFRYEDVVPLMLRASKGRHVHIGNLPDAMLDRIRDNISAASIPDDRFVYLPFVANLWRALLEHKVDVYVGSFPLGGGRATVEAMGAGLPLIIHSNYRSHFLSVEFEVYEGAMIWREPDQLAGFLSDLSPDKLADHAGRSRRHYEAHHRPERLRAAMERAAQGAPSDLPPRPAYRPNLLQAYLDERHAFWTFSGGGIIVSEQDVKHRQDELSQLQGELSRLHDVQAKALVRLEKERRAEVERVRQETTREMLLRARARKLLRKVATRIGIVG